MLKAISVAENIWWVGVNDRKTHLFENLWSLPYGVSYNSYLIDDEKVALIDGVKAEFFGEYLERIQSILNGRPVDYLIVNHVEPDHSSAIRMLRQVYPNITIVSNKQALNFVKQFYGESASTKEVKDGETLDLGAHKLTFAAIPMVHWPETMVSFESTTGIVFSCDAFGSYGALNGGIFDDEMDMHVFTAETRRYYATIVGRFSTNVQAALKKASALPIKMICPSHGPIHRGEGVAKVVALYDSLSPELQAIVDDCGQKAVEYQRKINRSGDMEILERWEKENGVEVYFLSEEEQAPFKALSDSVYQFYADLLQNDDGMSHDDVVAFLASFGVTVE